MKDRGGGPHPNGEGPDHRRLLARAERRIMRGIVARILKPAHDTCVKEFLRRRKWDDGDERH